MKKLLLFILFGLFIQTSFSQVYVEDQNINELDIKYLQLVGLNPFLSSKVKIYVDYGQPTKFMKSYKIKNAEGKPIKFNSIIDALNFMDKNGWEFVNYSQTAIGNKVATVFLLKKKE